MDLERIFSIASLVAMVGWAALMLAPIRRGLLVAAARWVGAILALSYAVLLVRGLLTPGHGGGGFSSLAQVAALFSNKGALLVGWIHYLAFDLWVGAWEIEDAETSGVPHWAMVPVLVLTFMFGPAGLLVYLLARPAFAGRKSKGRRRK